MGKIGFPDKTIVKRLFDIFDLDGGGERNQGETHVFTSSIHRFDVLDG